MNKFRVGLTRDFLTSSGELTLGDIGLEALRNVPGVAIDFFSEYLPEVAPEQIAGYDAVISLAPKYTRKSLAGADMKLSVLARVGVSYAMVDIDVVTEWSEMISDTPYGVLLYRLG